METLLVPTPSNANDQGAENDEEDETEAFSGVQGQCGFGSDGREQDTCRVAQRFEVHPYRITEWKRQLSERAAAVFGKSAESEPAVDLKVLHAKIGQLTLENNFFRKCTQLGGIAGLWIRPTYGWLRVSCI